MGLIPGTGNAISMGKVNSAYTGAAYPTAGGTGVRLSAVLGASYGGKAAGQTISFSSTFGGKTTPFDYPS